LICSLNTQCKIYETDYGHVILWIPFYHGEYVSVQSLGSILRQGMC